MFNFSKKDKKAPCPIPDERREWLEHAFEWLVGAFGEEAIRKRRALVPHHSDFPIRYNGDRQTAWDTLAIVARQMELDPGGIEDFTSFGWQQSGYLKQMDWGYVLALFARLRNEEDPEWAKHLCKNLQSDYTKSYRYLLSVK